MKVGFIGLGTQGKYLAVNLAQAGHDLMVYDVRREPLVELEAAGAKIARSPREVGAHGDVVEVCVLNDAQVDEVVAGTDGVLAGAARGTIICVHSTIEPTTIARLADRAAAKGVELIDVPVSGSEAGAKAKTMSYMVGGSAERVREMPAALRDVGAEDHLLRPARQRHPREAGASAHHRRQHARGLRGDAAWRSNRGCRRRSWKRWCTRARRRAAWPTTGSRCRCAPARAMCSTRICSSASNSRHDLKLSAPGAALAQQMLDRIVPTKVVTRCAA